MKKPMKKSMAKPAKSPVKDSGKVKMAAMRGGVSPGAKVPGGAGAGAERMPKGSGGGTEGMPKSFGGGKVQGGGIAGRGKP